MYEFISKQNKKLTLDLEGRGVTFRYVTRAGVFHVGRSWASIHALLAKLQNWQTHSESDQSLDVWMHNQELCLRFRTPEMRMDEVCKFSPEESARIMDFLGRAPNLN